MDAFLQKDDGFVQPASDHSHKCAAKTCAHYAYVEISSHRGTFSPAQPVRAFLRVRASALRHRCGMKRAVPFAAENSSGANAPSAAGNNSNNVRISPGPKDLRKCALFVDLIPLPARFQILEV